MKLLLLSLFSCFISSIYAQNITVTGHIFDNKHRPLPGATAYLFTSGNPNHKFGNVAEIDGSFSIKGLSPGIYTMQISFVGFNTLTQTVKITQSGQNLGNFNLREQAIALKEVTAVGRASRAVQLTDTLRYNADAFKTIQGADVQTLISKMPGIVVDNSGNVQAQGEAVQNVLVDGKPFFNGDPTLALKNLPADIVQNIEVFDKKTEQAEFTGFDDGNSIKTINIVTRKGMQYGVFGKIIGGLGVNDDKDADYEGYAAVNLFHGNQRITLLGMSNNINIQNFSSEDLAGVMSSTGGRGGRGGSAASSMVGIQSGITKTNAIGLNYTDKWGSNIDVTGGYFFNMTNNVQGVNSNGTYFATDSLGQKRTYNGLSNANSINYNHRFNLKIDYKIDDNNSLTFMPAVTLQKNTNNNMSNTNTYWSNVLANTSNTQSSTNTLADNLTGSLLYRHKFPKKGRTISAELDVAQNTSNNDGSNLVTGTIQTDIPNRTINSNSGGYSYGGSLIYTEPLSQNSMLQGSYRVSYNHRDINQYTYNSLTQALDTALSNVYNSDYLTQQAGFGYRVRNNSGLMAMATLNLQHADLNGNQSFPKVGSTDISFNSMLPIILINYKINDTNALRFTVRSSSTAPSIQQLQNVVNSSNPSAITGGNPNLDQQITNKALLRYTLTPTSGQTLIIMFSASNTSNYIGNSVFYNSSGSTTTLANGYQLSNGAQYSYPVNLAGNWTAASLVTFGFPVDFIKSNLNLSNSLSYTRLPSIYNDIKLTTNNYTVAPLVVLGSNISDKLDFTLSYGATFNIANNAIASSQNNTYLNQSAVFKLDWILWKGLTLQNQFTYQNNSGLSAGYNMNYYLWNFSLGKKILKNQRGEIKLQAYDILHQNKSLVHNVYDTYYENDESNYVLKPYYMVIFTWDLRNFKGQQDHKRQQDQDKQRRQHWDGGDRPTGMPSRDGGAQGGFGGPQM